MNIYSYNLLEVVEEVLWLTIILLSKTMKLVVTIKLFHENLQNKNGQIEEKDLCDAFHLSLTDHQVFSIVHQKRR